MPKKPLGDLRATAEQEADSGNTAYEEYRRNVEKAEANIGKPGPSCTEETYSQHPPGSPVGGGDAVARKHNEVTRAFERVQLRNSGETRVGDEEALEVSRKLVAELESIMPVPDSHPLCYEVTRTKASIIENARIITACISRYPREGNNQVKLPRDGGKLMYESAVKRLSLNNDVCLDAGSGQLYARGGTGTDGLVADGSAARQKAQDWARSLIGKCVLSGDCEAWHDGEKMARHSWHAAAAEWHDLMEWMGACPQIRDLFYLSATTDAA